MKYQIFLRTTDNKKMCSVTVKAKNEDEAKIKALYKAKKLYGLDFVPFRVFKD